MRCERKNNGKMETERYITTNLKKKNYDSNDWIAYAFE